MSHPQRGRLREETASQHDGSVITVRVIQYTAPTSGAEEFQPALRSEDLQA